MLAAPHAHARASSASQQPLRTKGFALRGQGGLHGVQVSHKAPVVVRLQVVRRNLGAGLDVPGTAACAPRAGGAAPTLRPCAAPRRERKQTKRKMINEDGRVRGGCRIKGGWPIGGRA